MPKKLRAARWGVLTQLPPSLWESPPRAGTGFRNLRDIGVNRERWSVGALDANEFAILAHFQSRHHTKLAPQGVKRTARVSAGQIMDAAIECVAVSGLRRTERHQAPCAFRRSWTDITSSRHNNRSQDHQSRRQLSELTARPFRCSHFAIARLQSVARRVSNEYLSCTDDRVSKFKDCSSPARAVYYPEVERALNDATGADRVFIFDHATRRRVPGAADSRVGPRQPVPRAAHKRLTCQQMNERSFDRFSYEVRGSKG